MLLMDVALNRLFRLPRSVHYKEFVKQRKAVKWYFPVWTFDELEKCQNYCYPDLSIDTLKKCHLLYGGVARFIFDIRSDAMEEALADVDAVKGVRNIGIPTSIFATSHTLLHMIVSSDGLYKFHYVEIASLEIQSLFKQKYCGKFLGFSLGFWSRLGDIIF